MALQHAASGERIRLNRDEDDIANFTSVALIKTDHMELIRLVLPTDKPLPEHRVEGEVAFDAHGRTTILQPNEMVYLAGGEPHTVRATKDAVALLTILLHPGDNSGGPTRDPRGAASA
jgi:quercetin dioxygenase-like cupin family protein